GRNADAFGQFNVGDSAVGLDFAEDFEVDLVKILRHAGPGPGGDGACERLSETVLAQLPEPAQFYCACGASSSPWVGKIRRYGLQFLHSLPDILNLDWHFRRRRDAFPSAFRPSADHIPLKREGSTSMPAPIHAKV